MKVALKVKGIQVFFAPAGKISHTKMLIVDGKSALIGSSNWSSTDTEDSHQVNWLIDDQPGVVGPMESWLDGRITSEGRPAKQVLGGS